MPLLFWDASALAKRYIPEDGSDSVDMVFAQVATSAMFGTVLGYAETYSVLLRGRNRGSIGSNTFLTAREALRREVLEDLDFTLLTVDNEAVLDGLALMDRYNLNATDAAILALFLRQVSQLAPGSPTVLFIAADRRLLAAAQAQGLQALNPTLVAAADVPDLLAAL